MAEINLSSATRAAWAINIGYDAISYTGNIINSIYTVNGTTGVLNNGLASWGGASNSPLTKGATTAFTTTTLSPAERQFQTGTRRDKFGSAASISSTRWTISTNIQHEHKEGTLEEFLRETYGGQAFTLPVDYDTDRFDLIGGLQRSRLPCR